jgi:asparagine synthase (glutamine-hydrolysing)
MQVGLLHKDGKPASHIDLQALLGEFSECEVETSGELVLGSLAMAYRGHRTTAEENTEVQPLKHSACALTFAGRLDNREEIANRIGLSHIQTIPDPAIIAAAYQELGDNVFSHLVGEFSLVLWCDKERTLTFVRSICGVHPLYYVLTKDSLIWSSNFAHLVRRSNVDLEVNENYLLEYLVSQPNKKQSPISRVQVIEAGTMSRFINGSFQSPTRLWDPNSVSPILFKSDHEYEEALRHHIDAAVRVRLRAKRPICSELSGGLDSSSVVLTTARILHGNNESIDNLRTVSCIYEESESCDERYFIRHIEERLGRPGFHVHEKDQHVTLGLSDIEFTGLPNPLHCYPGRYPAFTSLMRDYGARVLLTGGGGDHLFWSAPDAAPVVADEMQKGNLLQMHRECRTWSRFTNVPYFQLLLKKALPLALGSIFPRASQYQRPVVPSWLANTHKDSFHLKVWDAKASTHSAGIPSSRAHIRQVEALFAQLSAGYMSEYQDIHVTHPYAHRPLVEFCLGLPVSQFLRSGQTRSLLRRALHDLLPAKVRDRKSKGTLDEPLARALQREWSQAAGDLSRWELCARGLVDPRRLNESLNAMRLGLQTLAHGNFLRVFSLERWLRSLSYIRSKCSTASPLRSSTVTSLAS